MCRLNIQNFVVIYLFCMFNSCKTLSDHVDEPNDLVSYTDIKKTNFRIYQKRLSWPQSLAYCEACVGRFAIFPDEHTAQTVLDFLYQLSKEFPNEFGFERIYWFGMTDYAKEKRWLWLYTNESANYSKWASLQPDHVTNDKDYKKFRPEHCAAVWHHASNNSQQYYSNETLSSSILPYSMINDDNNIKERHQWNDRNCREMHYFICELIDKPIVLASRSNCTSDQAIKIKYSAKQRREIEIPKKFMMGRSIFANIIADKTAQLKIEKEDKIRRLWSIVTSPPPIVDILMVRELIRKQGAKPGNTTGRLSAMPIPYL